MTTIADMEHRLQALQRRFVTQKQARDHVAASRTREEYRRLHAKWLAAKRQGRLM